MIKLQPGTYVNYCTLKSSPKERCGVASAMEAYDIHNEDLKI